METHKAVYMAIESIIGNQIGLERRERIIIEAISIAIDGVVMALATKLRSEIDELKKGV